MDGYLLDVFVTIYEDTGAGAGTTRFWTVQLSYYWYVFRTDKASFETSNKYDDLPEVESMYSHNYVKFCSV